MNRKKPRKKGKKSNWDNSQFEQSNGKRGNKETWGKAAGLLLKNQGQASDHLVALGLTEMPTSLAALKKAYRKAMLTAHPDTGGTEEKATEVIQAYEILCEQLQKLHPHH